MAGLLNVQVFKVAGSYTYTPTAGTVSILIEMLGGGGGGGGAAATTSLNAAGGGGGAGAYAIGRVTSGFSGVTVTVGAGGAGGTGSAVGTSGGTTSFGSVLTATGGGGGGNFTPAGLPNAVYGGAGGVASGIACLNPGAQGAYGETALAITNNQVSGGFGANTIYGGGGIAEESGNSLGSGPQMNAAGYGSGGGGGANAANGILKPDKTGGTGAGGLVVIWEYT